MNKRKGWVLLALLLAGSVYAQQTESDFHRRIKQVATLTDETEAWSACQELMKLPAFGQDRLDIIDLYVNKGFRYVQKKFQNGSTDFEEIQVILQNLLPYAVKNERLEIRNAEAYLARLKAAYYSKRAVDSTYLCLTEAYDGYTGWEGRSQQAEILATIRRIEQLFMFSLEKEACKDKGDGAIQSDTLSRNLTPDEVGALLQGALHDDSLNYTLNALLKFLIVKKHTRKLASEGEWRIHIVAMIRAMECYQHLRRYREAWNMCLQLLSLPLTAPEQKRAESSALKCGDLLASALLRGEQKEYKEARDILERILPFARPDRVPKIQNKLARTWLQEGVDAFFEMKQDTAAFCYQNALRLYQLGGDVEQQAVLLLHLSETESCSGNMKEASRLLEQAQILARQVGVQPLQRDITKRQLLVARSENDRKAYAEWAHEWDLQPDSSMQKLYDEWGDRMVALGNYDMAGFYYEKSLLGNTSLSRDVLLSAYYDKMCNLYVEARDYVKAEKYGREAVKMGPLTRYTDWIRLGIIYAGQHNWLEFEACYKHLLEIAVSEQSGARERALIYSSRALGYTFFWNWHRACEDLQKADNILTTHYGPSDSGRLNVLSLLGAVLSKMEQTEKACQVYRSCVKLARKTAGEYSLACSNALEKQAQAEWMLGRKKQGCQLYARSISVLQSYVRSQLRYVSPTEREVFWQENIERLWNMSAYAVRMEAWDNAFTETCYDALLFSKGLLLESEKSMSEVLQREGTPYDRKVFQEICDLQTRITGLRRDEAYSKDTLAMWQTQMQRLDHELTVRSQAYADYTAFLDWDFRKVKECLNDHEVLVDFVDYVSFRKERQYAAFLIRKDWKYPLLLRLCTQEELDNLMREKPVDFLYRRENSRQIQELLWRRISSYIKEGETVYYVPSGDVYQLSFESLPADNDSLLGEHYLFVRLSSARELAPKECPEKETRTAVLYGGLQYDLSTEEMQSESRKYPASSFWAVRSLLRGDSVFAALPESREEVRQIADLLQADHYQVTVYEGALGSEESFLNLNGRSPRLLHLATHGFYFTPDEARQYDYLRGFQNAMYLSGLVLSGGNAVWQGKELPEGVMGGILTAQDIASLDLSGTDLVVLSACQSGRGKITAEGLYGLQRAFKKAGVQTLVLTLWRISDRVTREFMVAFYQNLADEKGDKRKAFEKARSQIRARYPEPFYWAGFIMTD